MITQILKKLEKWENRETGFKGPSLSQMWQNPYLGTVKTLANLSLDRKKINLLKKLIGREVFKTLSST